MGRKWSGTYCKRFNIDRIGHFIEQQYFKLFFTTIEGRTFLPVLRGHLFAEVTFTVTGRLGLVAVFAERGSDGALVDDETH